VASLDGVKVQHCQACHGILLGNEPFRELLRRRRQRYDGPDDKPFPLNLKELERHTECPQCRGTMDVHPYYGPGNAVLDTCFGCRLIWLDRGELAALERAPGLRR
jgi:Zn-finger nucleic acid-binding protein